LETGTALVIFQPALAAKIAYLWSYQAASERSVPAYLSTARNLGYASYHHSPSLSRNEDSLITRWAILSSIASVRPPPSSFPGEAPSRLPVTTVEGASANGVGCGNIEVLDASKVTAVTTDRRQPDQNAARVLPLPLFVLQVWSSIQPR
jgi:hypothetical protein